jgi:Uncharacterized protein conserved in bacteria (DUF2330)
MAIRIGIVLSLTAACLVAYLVSHPAQACCPAGPKGKPVVNADQTVVILWDAATKIQHFIRQASFKSEADDFGFLVPSPSQPELEESGNEAFPYLGKLTEPEIKLVKSGGGMGCGCDKGKAPPGRGDTSEMKKSEPPVKVLQEKLVAGFHAAVLETKSSAALVEWLKDNGYAFSPEVEAWAKPYVEAGWKITALKVAKAKDEQATKSVTASALRISFKTDRPLFPYREPDYKSAADSLGAKRRLLRIFFLADARFQGELTKESSWTGKVAWAGKLSAADRTKILEQLKLPETTGPAEWWLTEFEDEWPYKVAPADVYFSRSKNQDALKREPIVRFVSLPYPTDATSYALVIVVILPALWLRLWRRWQGKSEAS